MASERIRNPPRKLGRLLSSSWPLGQTESPKKFFGGVIVFPRKCFLLLPFSKSLFYLCGCRVYNKCRKSLDLKPLGEESKLSVYEEDGRILQIVY
jgi:hypothetical protein